MLPTFSLLLATTFAYAEPEEPAAPAIGAKIRKFSLDDIHRRPRSLADFAEKKAIVVVFVGTGCPLVNLYLPTLMQLHEDYAKRGVQILLINSNSGDSFVEVSAHGQDRELPFPVLKDFDHRVADLFGAERTPEAFLLDEKRTIRYHGRIDDQYTVGFRRPKPTKTELKDAIEQLLGNQPIATPTTDAEGCLIGREEKPRVRREVTYTKDVAPILQQRCQECHRPGEIGPFSLMKFGDAKGWARMLHEVVLEERMPPWHADPHHGKFANDRRLSRAERDTLLTWVEQGCPEGDPKDLPPPRKFPKGWKIGTPDKVYHMPEEFTVPATGVLDYKKFVVDPGFTEDVWVQSAECRPGNRAVVHHILIYIKAPGKRIYAADGTASSLVGWAPGDMPTMYRPGIAKRIPAGSKFVFEVHYTPTGVEQTDRCSLGIIFAKKPPKYEAETNILADMRFRIPAGASDYKNEFRYTFRKDATLLSLMPHMHLRGTSAKYVLTYPDGKSETILSVPDYDFNWQSIYRFEKPIAIPKGTKLKWIAGWDNSADNPRNPDPSKSIRWGLQTWDEMQNGWMEVIWTSDPLSP